MHKQKERYKMQIWKNWEICKIENNQKDVIFKSFLGKYITTKPQFSCYFLQLIILFHYITVPTKLGAVRFVLYVFSFLHTHTLPSMQSPCYAYIIIIFEVGFPIGRIIVNTIFTWQKNQCLMLTVNLSVVKKYVI